MVRPRTDPFAVIGYAYIVLFRKRPAYRYMVKHSIYVHHDNVGKVVGSLLLRGLIDACAAAGFRQIIGYIDADNTVSPGLHERFDFSPSAERDASSAALSIVTFLKSVACGPLN